MSWLKIKLFASRGPGVLPRDGQHPEQQRKPRRDEIGRGGGATALTCGWQAALELVEPMLKFENENFLIALPQIVAVAHFGDQIADSEAKFVQFIRIVATSRFNLATS